MIKIEKEIKVIRYVAFDGTEFDTERECANYEGSAFGKLVMELPVLSVKDEHGMKCYGIVPMTRHDIFVLNQVLQMGGAESANADDCNNLVVLQVVVCCNVVVEARLNRPYEWVKEMSNGNFIVVSTIKDERTK